MHIALALASRARGRTSPNPMVGAVIVKNNRIVGKGYHHRAGQPHAEVNALADAGPAAVGADLYLNLEPCSHYGRTPPCADAVIAAGIKRAFVGMEDPNPNVSGRGIQRLRAAGISVEAGICEAECRKLNEVFIKYISTGLPFVILKAATSLDGRIAAETGDSKWISSEASRAYVHRMRDEVDAILVGIGTVLKDDPQLTTRIPGRRGKDPTRVVVDSALRLSPQAKIFNPKSKASVIIATTQDAPSGKIRALEDHGAQVLVLPGRNMVDLPLLMAALGRQEISSVLVEGGSRINTSALASGVVDKVLLFYAPILIGGTTAPLLVAGKGVPSVDQALRLHSIRTRRFGDDVVIEGYVHKTVDRCPFTEK
nr:bifunctional diaminohydroxyphosphoribosylaminopyrimidine deaminase/5-amino-6-(5-phosphoribosylamino)uracil reductase RibD [Deltaproteobacteria bacterium]